MFLRGIFYLFLDLLKNDNFPVLHVYNTLSNLDFFERNRQLFGSLFILNDITKNKTILNSHRVHIQKIGIKSISQINRYNISSSFKLK